VQDNVADGYDTVNVAGQARHVVGYLQDFLFTAERCRTPVKFLSGGERNRILLAKLFAKPANVIVLDEPTNDLDAETLELLEDRLVQFNGTVLLVSHDREFLNNVVSSTLVFENGSLRECVGGYDDWLRQRPVVAEPTPSRKECPSTLAKTPVAETKKRLSFKQQQELASLPARIEQLEADIAALHAAMGEATFYQQPGDRIAAEQGRLGKYEVDLTALYARWEELDQLSS
jgi:ATP-binding cassette subfamily F protein uup